MAAGGPNLYECAMWHLNNGGTYEKHSKHVTNAPTCNMYFEISWRTLRMQFLDQDFGCAGQLGELHLNWGGGRVRGLLYLLAKAFVTSSTDDLNKC
jgi:hypothetical protein